MHDGEHQGTEKERLLAHVGKDRNTEAAQDETGVEHASSKGPERGRGHITLRGGHWQPPSSPELTGPASASFFCTTFDLFSLGLPYFMPRNALSATMSHR